MHRFLAILLIVGLVGCASVAPSAPDIGHLTILHWNDFHSHNIPYEVTAKDSSGTTTKHIVGGSAALDSYLRHFGRGTPEVVVVNAGDDFQGTPISGLTNGESQVALMNLLNPDVATLGNHEFDYGSVSLSSVLEHAHTPFLTANLYDSSTATTYRPATLLRRCGSVNVGFIGLLPPDLDILTMKGNLHRLSLLNVDSVLNAAIPALRKSGAQLIVAISHMGIEVDTALASRRHDIDIIVGGHSHTPVFKPIRVQRTTVVQAGSWGRYLGKLDLAVDLKGDSVLAASGGLIETIPGVYPEDSTVVRTVAKYEAKGAAELSEIVATLAVDWKTSLFTETNIGNWECDVIRDYTGADVVFVNSGGIRRDVPKGPVRQRDFWEVDPFNNTLVAFRVSGVELRAILEWQASRKSEFMQVSGIRYKADRSAKDGERVLEASVGGKPLVLTQQYTLVTNNYVAGHLDALLGLKRPVEVRSLMACDRDVLIHAARQQGTIASEVDGRIIFLNDPYNKVAGGR